MNMVPHEAASLDGNDDGGEGSDTDCGPEGDPADQSNAIMKLLASLSSLAPPHPSAQYTANEILTCLRCGNALYQAILRRFAPHAVVLATEGQQDDDSAGPYALTTIRGGKNKRPKHSRASSTQTKRRKTSKKAKSNDPDITVVSRYWYWLSEKDLTTIRTITSAWRADCTCRCT